MRMMKLALVTGIAVLVSTGSASAITAKKRTEAPGLPPEIWAIVGEFCTIEKWHPAVAKCEESKEGDVTFRTLTLKDGGKIKEKLTGTEATAYTYEIVESPLPVKNYEAQFSLTPDDDDEDEVNLVWAATYDAADGKDAKEARGVIDGIFKAGIDSLKDKVKK